MKLRRYGNTAFHVLATFAIVYLLIGILGIHLALFITFSLQMVVIARMRLKDSQYSPWKDTVADIAGYGFFGLYIMLK